MQQEHVKLHSTLLAEPIPAIASMCHSPWAELISFRTLCKVGNEASSIAGSEPFHQHMTNPYLV